MKKSELKILAMEFCFNSDLPAKTKKKHLKFIKENADGYQCIGYILDGKFYNLNDTGKEELKRRFVKEQSTRKTAHSVIGAVGAGPIGAGAWAIYRGLRAMFNQCSRACGTFGINTAKRQFCMISCKAKVKQKEVAELQKSMNLCNQGNNPEKCKQKIMNKINKAKGQLQGLNQNLVAARQKMVQKGKDTTRGDDVEPGDTKIV